MRLHPLYPLNEHTTAEANMTTYIAMKRYLRGNGKRPRIHLMNGEDSWCGVLSRAGRSKKKYQVLTENPGLQECVNCHKERDESEGREVKVNYRKFVKDEKIKIVLAKLDEIREELLSRNVIDNESVYGLDEFSSPIILLNEMEAIIEKLNS